MEGEEGELCHVRSARAPTHTPTRVLPFKSRHIRLPSVSPQVLDLEPAGEDVMVRTLGLKKKLSLAFMQNIKDPELSDTLGLIRSRLKVQD